MEKVSLFVNRIINSISGILMLALTLITVADVLGRFIFNSPIPGRIEATEMSLVLIAFLTYGYAEHFNEHVVIDTVYELMPKPLKRGTFQFSKLLSVAIIILMTWQLIAFAGKMKAGDYHTAVLGIKYFHVIIIASVGSAFYALAIISNMIIHFKEQRGRLAQ